MTAVDSIHDFSNFIDKRPFCEFFLRATYKNDFNDMNISSLAFFPSLISIKKTLNRLFEGQEGRLQTDG